MIQGVVFEWYGPEVIERIESVLSDRIEKAANDVADETRRLLDDPEPGGRHTHSRPGQSPARITGALEQSIVVESEDPLSRCVGTDLDYGLWLETGSARMAPRPFLTRALEQSLDNIRDLVTARID
jgi:hypothetical protein